MKFKIFAACILVGLLNGPIAFALDKDNYPIQYTLSPDAKITAEIEKSKYLFIVNFTGEFKFTGNYTVEYDESRKTKLIIIVKPTESLDNYLTLKDRGKKVEIDEFFVGEKPKLIKSLLGDKYYSDMMSGNIKHISGQAIFLIDGFSATYECDHLVYYSEGERVIQITEHAAIVKTGNTGSC